MDIRSTDIREINRFVIEKFRAGGPVSGMNRDRLLLLTTTGRRSGQPHTTPMMFHVDGDRILVIASASGAPEHPDWYLNLAADPHVEVERGDERWSATAVELVGVDREPAWELLTRTYPFFADHEQQAAPRVIPVVVLTRR